MGARASAHLSMSSCGGGAGQDWPGTRCLLSVPMGSSVASPAALAAHMERLARLTHRIVWVNPLMGDAQYQPLARGMAAALPHIDYFLAGHSLGSLEELSEVLADIA